VPSFSCRPVVLAYLAFGLTTSTGASADGGESGGDGGQAREAGSASPARAKLRVFDDGLRVPGDPKTPLPASPWGSDTVSLFALRGETVAFQVVLEGEEEAATPCHAVLGAFDGTPLQVTLFAEDFVDVRRSSGNDRNPDESLAFTRASKPEPALVGPYADALLPDRDAVLSRTRRAAFWIDVQVPVAAAPGPRSSRLAIVSAGGVVGEVTVNLEIVDRELPYAALPVMVYYEPEALKRRMGALRAEPALRALFHSHHVAAIRPVLTERDLEAEVPYLTGEAFTGQAGYFGPGAGRGEGIVVLGAYGDLGEPVASKVPLVAKLHARASALGPSIETFLYAVDEDCKSPWPAAWKKLLAADEGTRSLRVGATCGDEPSRHPADIVLQVPEDLSPARLTTPGKSVWAYNGKRPFSGAAVLDVPATDLRANAWIAARYGIPRWFYWEATSWTSYGGGKVGGDTDPFEVADSFHNKDGDHSNGDGILVYPGTQTSQGMRSYGLETVFPSVRLKNVRRGIQDVGYLLLARAHSVSEADAVVARAVPSALSEAKPGSKPSWSDDARPWLDARRELLAIVRKAPKSALPSPLVPAIAARRDSTRPSLAMMLALALVTTMVFAFGKWVSRKESL
jgi:hypothetical protein